MNPVNSPEAIGSAFLARTVYWVGLFALLAASAQVVSAARERPYLLPATERQRVLDRIARSPVAKQQFDDLRSRADRGEGYAAALVFALTAEPRYAETARNQLLGYVRYRTPSLEADIAAGGHREGNMDFYWNTNEVRIYDLIYSVLSEAEREEIATFFRRLGRYWVSSLKLWTTTPNLIFPIHYHAAVIGYCIEDAELVEWGLHDDGGQFGPTRGGLHPVLDSMLRDGAIWDEANLYAVVNVLRPALQFCVIARLYDGQDLYNRETAKGASVRKMVDGYIALGYPRERINATTNSFRVATYGDGSTASPLRTRQEDVYLVNGQYAHSGTVMTEVLELAYYLSHDPKYAWFLAQANDYVPSLLYGEDLDRAALQPPPAPSSIYPEAGIAMLRAEESPEYWLSDSLAVLQVMAKGYGHDHRDKLSITLHGAGRLLYPDLNCVQYENFNVHWTRNGIAHNTVLVDRQDPADFPYQTKHDFSPEVKFLATAASCYPGVNQVRALALTREYLLDLFLAQSEVPHTYDWVLHAIGKVSLEQPELGQRTYDLLKDYWWIEDERRLVTGRTWRADFVQRTGLAVPGYGYHDETWFQDRACVRVTMIGEPQTQVFTGYGPSGGPPADPVINPEGSIPLLLARRHERSTVFATVHEPYKQEPTINQVRRLVATETAYVVGLEGKGFVDRVAVAFGEQGSAALRSQEDAGEFFVFQDFGYLRYLPGAEPRLFARGNWQGFQIRCPDLPAQGALLLNGRAATYTKRGEYVRYGQAQAPPPLEPLTVSVTEEPPAWVAVGDEFSCAWTVENSGTADLKEITFRPVLSANLQAVTEEVRLPSLRVGERRVVRVRIRALPASRQPRAEVRLAIRFAADRGAQAVLTEPLDLAICEPLELTGPEGPLALPKQGTKETVFRIKNWTSMPLRPELRLSLPSGIEATLAAGPLIAPGETGDIPVAFTTRGETQGLFTASVTLVSGLSSTPPSGPTPLQLCVGPVLLEDLSFPAFGEFVACTPNYTFRLSQLYGASRCFRDANGRPLYEKTFWNRRTSFEFSFLTECLPMLNQDGKPLLIWGQPSGFFWPQRSPAAVTMSAGMNRYEWHFEEDRITIRPVLYWSQEKPHEFVFPAGWVTWGGKPTWQRVWVVDGSGQEQALDSLPGEETELQFTAAALRLPGQDVVIVVGVDRPQSARFNGAELRVSVKPGEMLWFGPCPISADVDEWVARQRRKDSPPR